MKNFKIVIEQTLPHEVVIKANDMKEARKKALEMYTNHSHFSYKVKSSEEIREDGRLDSTD